MLGARRRRVTVRQQPRPDPVATVTPNGCKLPRRGAPDLGERHAELPPATRFRAAELSFVKVSRVRSPGVGQHSRACPASRPGDGCWRVSACLPS
jgi:hypothetical protein